MFGMNNKEDLFILWCYHESSGELWLNCCEEIGKNYQQTINKLKSALQKMEVQ